MKPRFIKVLRDLKTDPVKNLVLVLAIAVGVIMVGAILGSYAILNQEMNLNYMGTHPASATIKIENGTVDQNLLRGAGNISGVLGTERRMMVLSRMKIGDDWYPLMLFVIDDFDNIKMNGFTRISGSWPPPTGTMLVERTALTVMKKEEGESVIVKTLNGEPKEIPISGIVHDAGLAPAWQEQCGYGYITLSTLQWLGEDRGFDEFRILTEGSSTTEIEGKTNEVVKWIESQGQSVHEVQIPPPGRHPHQSQMNGILSLFMVFGFMTLILSAILVTTSISTLMTRQIREIGVMKTFGANSVQISGLYLFMILAISVLAIVIGIPFSQYLASVLVKQIAVILNLTLFGAAIPLWVFAVQGSAGILIPVAAAVVPVLRGSRITVKEALNNYGVSQNNFGQGRLESVLAGLRLSGKTITLSVRNVFRHRGRLIMALLLLAAGGAMFMTSMNISKAWDANLQKLYESSQYDLEVQFEQPIQSENLIARIRQLPDVKEVEAWGRSPTSLVKDVNYDVSNTYPDDRHNFFVMLALPTRTKLVDFPVLEGHWLNSDNNNDVVLNQNARARAPDLKVGDTISLSIDGRPSEWRIVGFVEEVGTPAATAFVSLNAFSRVSNTGGLTNMIRISLTSRDSDTVLHSTREIEQILEKEKAPVITTLPISMIRTAIGDHMTVLVSTLLAVAILMAVVGAFGLMSTMGMNIFERTRELGVMRAIGATPMIISRLVINEGLVIGGMSLGFAFLLSLLLSAVIGNLIGNMSFRIPLPLVIDPLAIVAWVSIVVLGSIFSTAYPAWRASRITIREALSYE